MNTAFADELMKIAQNPRSTGNRRNDGEDHPLLDPRVPRKYRALAALQNIGVAGVGAGVGWGLGTTLQQVMAKNPRALAVMRHPALRVGLPLLSGLGAGVVGARLQRAQTDFLRRKNKEALERQK